LTRRAGFRGRPGPEQGHSTGPSRGCRCFLDRLKRNIPGRPLIDLLLDHQKLQQDRGVVCSAPALDAPLDPTSASWLNAVEESFAKLRPSSNAPSINCSTESCDQRLPRCAQPTQSGSPGLPPRTASLPPQTAATNSSIRFARIADEQNERCVHLSFL
jgi:hypothetical protein